MRWIRKWLGLQTSPLEQKKKELSALRHKAFLAQRNGNLRLFGSLSKDAANLEDEIVELLSKSK